MKYCLLAVPGNGNAHSWPADCGGLLHSRSSVTNWEGGNGEEEMACVFEGSISRGRGEDRP